MACTEALDMKWFFPRSTGPVERTHWRTYLVFSHTFWGSLKVLASATRGTLTPEKVDARIARWCERVFRVSHTALGAEGLQNVEGTPSVLLSNHVSLLDIPSVCATWPGRVRFVAKQELRKVPAFGAAMEAAGIVFVNRGDRAKAIAQLEAAHNLLASGTSLWIAAEGGRSRDGRLHGFKKGAFHVAVNLQVPIVPVWIQGTLDVLPPDQFRSVTDQVVTVHYGQPIPTRGCTRDDLPRLMATARASLLALARQAGAGEDVDAA
jgi:1-acyl-sn-glycerol-3-phosphate acyltransferase